MRLYNIWDDPAAASFVRHHNHGDETVPTVAVGNHVWVNPAPGAFVNQLRRQHPHLIEPAAPPPWWRGRWRRKDRP